MSIKKKSSTNNDLSQNDVNTDNSHDSDKKRKVETHSSMDSHSSLNDQSTTTSHSSNSSNKEEKVLRHESIEPANDSRAANGLWSWLGYPAEAPQKEAVTKVSITNNDETTTSIKTNQQESDITEKDNNSINSSIDQEIAAGESAQPSYWKSLFGRGSTSSSNTTTSKNEKDPVIVEEKGLVKKESQSVITSPSLVEKTKEEACDSTAIEPFIEPRQANNSALLPPIPTSSNSIVLPTFKSQFHHCEMSDSNNTANGSNQNIFIKAMSAINSILFSHNSLQNQHSTHTNCCCDFDNKHELTDMIQSIKNNPHTLKDRKFLVIGVHGWFPMKLVRSMIGEPSGTSTKFCDQMVAAVKKYFLNTYGVEIPDSVIQTIPLQWEGKVMERVDKLYHVLKNEYKEALREADVILWVTHSQGTPVSAILLRRLMEEKIIQAHRQPVCMMAMAGISHGPFPSIKGNVVVRYFEAEAARELFKFMDSTSHISIQYQEAMAYILHNNTKVVLIASFEDQVVPMYSAIMSGLSHPNILRAVYIGGHVYAEDDFLIRLVVFALQLLNAGLSDHGFLIHISEVLAGNLYAFERGGHSTIYEELDVFTLPLEYLFGTCPFGSLEAVLKPSMNTATPTSKTQEQKILDKVEARLDPFEAKLKLNPYHLPWAMRGIWDDPRILNNEILSRELDKLLDLFDKWNPVTAKLKEIKFRLEPLKARL